MHRIAKETRLVGTLQGVGDLLLEGAVEGKLQLDGGLTLSETGAFHGEAMVQHAEISGRLTGTLTASGSLRLLAGSVVEATLQATRLEVHPEARVRGAVEVTDTTLWETPAPSATSIPAAAPARPRSVAASDAQGPAAGGVTESPVADEEAAPDAADPSSKEEEASTMEADVPDAEAGTDDASGNEGDAADEDDTTSDTTRKSRRRTTRSPRS